MIEVDLSELHMISMVGQVITCVVADASDSLASDKGGVVGAKWARPRQILFTRGCPTVNFRSSVNF